MLDEVSSSTEKWNRGKIISRSKYFRNIYIHSKVVAYKWKFTLIENWNVFVISCYVSKLFLECSNYWKFGLNVQLPEAATRGVLYKKSAFKISSKFTGKHLCQSFFFREDSGTSVFLWILWNFQEYLFYRTAPNDYF